MKKSENKNIKGRIGLKVVPNASKNKWSLDKSGILKCHLKSPPKEGRANSELIKILSKLLKIPQWEIKIISGVSSRNKVIEIPLKITEKEFLKILGLWEEPVKEKQQKILF